MPGAGFFRTGFIRKKNEYSGNVQIYKPRSLFATPHVFNVSALKHLNNWEAESLSVAFCS